MASDKTLFRDMEEAVREFDVGRVSFRELLDRLEANIENISDEDMPWKEAFQREWGRLEDAYAYASFQGHSSIPERDMPAIKFALKEVRRLIGEKTAMRL